MSVMARGGSGGGREMGTGCWRRIMKESDHMRELGSFKYEGNNPLNDLKKKRNVRKIGWWFVDWIHLAQDKDWKVHVVIV